MRKIKSLIYPLLSISLLGGLTGCHSDPAVPQSEKYVSASENFSITTPLTTNLDAGKVIDFTMDSLRFDAEFSEEVSWEITITGKSDPVDNAVKTIKGTSKELSFNDDLWAGESDNIYFFRKGEELDIQFSCLGCNNDVLTSLDGFSITETKKFKGLVILNFEGEGALLNSNDDVNIFFDENGANEELRKGKFVTVDSFPSLNLPRTIEGNRFIYMKGRDALGQPDPFFIGGMNNNAKKFGLEGDASEWFLNFYANSNGNRTTKIIPEIPGVGGDAFSIERNITWDGWRLVSIRLSDFIQSSSGANGIGELRPALVTQILIGLHSGGGTPGNEAEVLIDYITFTKGAPFSQSN